MEKTVKTLLSLLYFFRCKQVSGSLDFFAFNLILLPTISLNKQSMCIFSLIHHKAQITGFFGFLFFLAIWNKLLGELDL